MLKEMTILVGKHVGSGIDPRDTFYYRFYEVINGKLEKSLIKKKGKQSTIDIYENILSHFLADEKNEKFLTFVGYNTIRPNQSKEEYLGLTLQNNKEEKLNIYFTSKSLEAFNDLEELMQLIKKRDFCNYASNYIDQNGVRKMTIRPSIDDRSSIVYIFDNEEYNSLRIQRQLGYYYRKSGHVIDELDVENICNIIRKFINHNLENHPRYEYNDILRIKCDKKIYLEIKDGDLIDQLEKKRIINDLWLVMNGVIEKMPSQEESILQKEELKRKRIKYLERKKLP